MAPVRGRPPHAAEATYAAERLESARAAWQDARTRSALVTVERFVSSPMVFLMDDEHHRCLGTPRRRERPCSATALALVLRQGPAAHQKESFLG